MASDSFTIQDFYQEIIDDKEREAKETYQETKLFEDDPIYCAERCNLLEATDIFRTAIEFMRKHGHDIQVQELLDDI